MPSRFGWWGVPHLRSGGYPIQVLIGGGTPCQVWGGRYPIQVWMVGGYPIPGGVPWPGLHDGGVGVPRCRGANNNKECLCMSMVY